MTPDAPIADKRLAELTAIAEQTPPHERPFLPFGAAQQLLACNDPEVLLSGPAGTGKSRAALETLYVLVRKFPGMRGVIVRKTRESLTESGLVTWEEKVLPPGEPALRGASRKLRQSYDFENGSSVIVVGMDKASKVMSAEYDVAYVQEAIELTENDWESLTTRLRNGVIPKRQQLFADTNPDKPSHWLKKRCDAGRTTMIECRHTDNPTLWDQVKQCWTPAGLTYISKLDALTGPRLQRLRYGRWVQAEGIVYPEWDAAVHLVDRFDLPKSWRRILSIDFGWNDPFVAQWWAIDDDGRMYLYRELVRTHRLVEDHAKDIAEFIAADGVDIVGMVCDHDREGRETLVRHLGRSNYPAVKELESGIQAVKSRLRVQGDGKPRLFVMRDSLVARDANLDEAKKPCGFVEEIDGYVWSTSTTRLKGEEPVDKDNHSMDAARYAVRFADALASGMEMHGSDPAQSILATLPRGTFARPEPVESAIGDIMGMRF